MRLKVEINDLTPEQWEKAQKILKTEYTIPDGASRVCLALIHGNEERHVETPVTALTDLLMSLTMGQSIKRLMDQVRVAMAALTPDDDRLPVAGSSDHAPAGDVTARDRDT